MKLKRLLPVLCSVLLLFAFLPFSASAAPTDTWDGSADTSWYTGGSSYTLTNAEQLAGLAELVNAGNEFYGVTITLGANLVLSSNNWTPIGDHSTDTSIFSGTFSGGGHSITGLNLNSNGNSQGLFGTVSNSGTIQDLTVYGTIAGGNYVGGIVGYCNGDITACTFSGNVSGNNCVGAIAGFCAGDLSDCHSTSGSVSGYAYCGGISGQQYGGNITDSSSACTVSADSHYTAGIAGSAERCTIRACSNTGDVDSQGDSTGGIVGYGQSASIKDCTNKGDVGGAKYTGGILGRGSSGSVVNCLVEGTVRGEEDCGGIVGLLEGGTVSNSAVYAGVSGSVSGGIAGRLSAGGQLKNCFTSGNVSGSDSGGIAGSASGGSAAYCYWRSGTASSATGDGNVSNCTSYSVEECFWALETQTLGCDDLLDALNAGRSDGMNRWYASSSYPCFREQYRLTIRCVDSAENELQVQRQLFAAGERYTINLPQLEGFLTEEPVLSGTMSSEDTVVTVLYVGETYLLTIEYCFEDGTQAHSPVEQETATGSKYSVPSPAIEGYVPNPETVEGTMPAEDTTVTVVYKPAMFTGDNADGTDVSNPEDETPSPDDGVDSSTEEDSDRGVQLNFFFWFLIVMIVIGLIVLVLLLCMLFNEDGHVARWINGLLYPESDAASVDEKNNTH